MTASARVCLCMSAAVFRRLVFCLPFVTVLIWGARAHGQANGIYADFTTSMGSFTCRLEYAIAPKAVANFIGLATGQRPWLDLNTGLARTNPFYNGITFHRVITNFVIQAGSPNAQGTDGPGYVVPDEIKTALRFNSPHMLAMANSGTNSNGSQFFITVSSQPSLNDGYTIFGQLVGGTNTVLNINHVAVDANSKPLTNIYIQSVGIRRVGPAAQAFDINTNNLPGVTNLPIQIANVSTQVSLAFNNRLYADNRIYSSTNLTTWSGENLGIEIAAPTTNSFRKTMDAPARFYSVAQIQYPSTTSSPKNVLGRKVTMNFSGGSGTIVVNFDSNGGGTYTYTLGSPGTITSYTWFQEPYRGRLWPISYSALVDMTLTLNFTSATSGTLNGTAYTFPPSAVSGTFTLN